MYAFLSELLADKKGGTAFSCLHCNVCHVFLEQT